MKEFPHKLSVNPVTSANLSDTEMIKMLFDLLIGLDIHCSEVKFNTLPKNVQSLFIKEENN
jgi:hypothetical protein